MTAKIICFSELGVSASQDMLSDAVLCFGHFNAIHPGHIRYFRKARQHGGPLVVALESDAQLLGRLSRQVFSERERAQAVASLDVVDYVVILDGGSLSDFVRQSSISVLVLGKEFERARAQKVIAAVATAKEKGVRVVYDAGEIHYASAELLHHSPSDLEKQRWCAFMQAQESQGVNMPDVFSHMRQDLSPQILVIGDTIVDRYVACDPVGMSNEAPVVVVKEIETRDYVGGAAIVAAHVATLGAKCKFLSVTGHDSNSEFVANSLDALGVDSGLIKDESRPTTLKIRYLVENQKLFRVSQLKEHSLSQHIEDQLLTQITKLAPDLDGILVSDFVYGCITPRLIQTQQEVSVRYDIPLFGDLQCSSQVGNILKLGNFFLICPTEREARIALANQDDGVEYIANLLMERAHCTNTIIKLGGEGFIAYHGREGEYGFVRRQHFPALTVAPVDVAGAGDALLSAMAVALTRGLSFMEASALACCVSAIAVQTVGNQPISLEQAQFLFSQNVEIG